MPQQKLTIIPVTLYPELKNSSVVNSTEDPRINTCTIKTATVEISFCIVEKFLDLVEKSPFYGKNALAKAAEYTLNGVNGLKAFLNDGRIEIDNNLAENAIRPNVIGRKNWLFSVSEAGAKANAICLSIAETSKANGVDFYQYLMKLMTDLPNLDIHRNLEILNQYMPWSKNIQTACGK